jgi:glycosyltransferase involved in cell wall biosynthesis
MPHSLRSALDEASQAPFIVDVLRDADRLARAAGRDGGPAAVAELSATFDAPDELTAIAATHALGSVFDDTADAVLSGLLSHPRAFLREHAAWVLQSRLPQLDAIDRLVDVVVAGGFSGMLAQRTLETWSGAAGDQITAALLRAPVSARVVETIGLIRGEVAGRAIQRIARDTTQPPAVRATAVAALGDRPGDLRAAATVTSLRRAGGEVGAAAQLAAVDLGLVQTGAAALRAPGLTIAQLFLHADLDRRLSRAGAGDNGGIATLLVRLGDALVATEGIGRVLTMSRGTPERALDALAAGDGHVLAAVPMPGPPTHAADAWPARVAVRRGIRRLLREHKVDVLHLRMAEVGSLAALEAAGELGIPVVFTLAPDPHAAILALDRTGGLRRDTFGEIDEREHYWFRARLVQRLTDAAEHVALFPRPDLARDLRDLLGVDVPAEPERFTVVPEGIDLDVIAQAAADVAAGGPDELHDLLRGLPEDRRGLPLAVSVGRLHRVKGMATLARAWADDEALRARCNLLIVGGDLADPSPDERKQLDLIQAATRDRPGLLLPGHRPNDVVARWLAVAQAGGGVYVCASLKEEFGLALVEALAAGLVVVGPDAGGPVTYIEPGVTGLLTGTSRPADLAAAVHAALDLAAEPPDDRVAKARRRVADGLTVQAMATSLSRIYATAPAAAARP